MNNYKINPDYALPDRLAIGMEGRFWDSDQNDPNDYEDSTLQGYYPDEDYKFATNKGRPARNFTPLQLWQPKPGDRRTGEIVYALCRNDTNRKLTLALPIRYAFFKEGNHYVWIRKKGAVARDIIIRYYGEGDIGMTIQEIIDSRKPGDVLGVE